MDKKRRLQDMYESLLSSKIDLNTAAYQLSNIYDLMTDCMNKIESLKGVIDYLTDDAIEMVEKEVDEHVKMVTEISEFMENYKFE